MQSIKSNAMAMQSLLEQLNNTMAYREGNRQIYSPDNVSYDINSPLNGKKIAFLGSSITYGAMSYGISFVEYLQAKDGIIPTKSAISGTTLAGTEVGTYLDRLQKDFNAQYDLFICQLSTNDSRQGKKMGQITSSFQKDNFDCNTTLGAIEYISQYVQEHFHCPLLFYTCLRTNEDHDYLQLINKTYQLAKKWHFGIIDLYNNEGLKSSTKIHPNAMADDAHPTQEGYLKIWLPVFEQALINKLSK